MRDAATVAIEADVGADPLAAIARPMGVVTTPPITSTTTFTLVAVGDGGTSRATVLVVATRRRPVRIVSFAAEPDMVEAGASVALSWVTEHATTVVVSERDGPAVGPPSSQARGSVQVTPAATTTYVLVARGEGGPVETEATVTVRRGAPRVTRFALDPTRVELGRSAELSWEAVDADRVEIDDPSGRRVYEGAEATGRRTVRPERSGEYRLRATSPAGTATAAVGVEVLPWSGARVDRFVAVPDAIDYGQSAVLSWATADAPGGVELAIGAVSATVAPMGERTVTPTSTTDYRLLARSPSGDAEARVTVIVRPVAPTIRSWVASPSPAGIGRTVALSWDTEAATHVVVRRVSPDPAVLEARGPVRGGLELVPTSSTVVLALEAVNPFGTTRAALSLEAEPLPSIARFELEPAELVLRPGTVELRWSVDGATRPLRLEVDGVNEPSFPGRSATGTHRLSLPGPVELRLIAESLAGAVSETLAVTAIPAEVEPNDAPGEAQALQPLPARLAGTIGGADRDRYTLTVVEGGAIHAEVSDGVGGCPVATRLSLVAPDGRTVLGVADGGGLPAPGGGRCARLDGDVQDFARDLAAGVYGLILEAAPGASGPYALSVFASPPACGNGRLERRAGESCDDGAQIDGDGCSARCAIEVLGTIRFPGAEQGRSGALSAARVAHHYRLELTSELYVEADSFTPSGPGCTGPAALELALLDAAFAPIGTAPSADCPTLSALGTPWVRLPAGTYHLRVRARDPSAVAGDYELLIRGRPTGCGNGVLELAPPESESCDDGNRVDGDGCSAQCRLDGEAETEPNDAAGSAVPITRSPARRIGALVPAGDTDWYAVDVPAGHHLEASLAVGTSTACPEDPRAALALVEPDGLSVRALAVAAGGRCPRLDPVSHPSATLSMAGGRYFLRVEEDGDDAPLDPYALELRVVAPGCGNGVLEAVRLETCDDGGARAGDGCDAQCRVEVTETLTPPGATRSLDLAAGATATFRLELPTPGMSVSATVTATGGGCPAAASLELLDEAFRPVAADVEASGCAILTAFDLPAGARHLRVGAGPAGGRLALALTLRPAACGNLRVERRAGEQCDDGNTLDGDGCSAVCARQAVASYAAPGATSVISGTIDPIGEVDLIRVDVSAPSYLDATVFAPSVASGGCVPPTDTRLRLLAADATTELGADDLSGPGLCSAFVPGTHPFARVSTGTYYLAIEAAGGDALIPAYELRLTGREADVCGNGLVETGEACDDGNRIVGDGCDAACRLEGGVRAEVEPNDGPGQESATGLAGVGAVTVSGVVSAGGDVDRWTLRVPAGAQLVLDLQTYGTAGNRASCNGDSRVELIDDTGSVLADVDSGGFGLCERLTGLALPIAMVERDYVVAVQYWHPSGSPSPFAYRLDLGLR